MIAQPQSPSERKIDLVQLGAWCVSRGKGWLAHAVYLALVREGLCHA
jgi:hypothetical protein